MAGDTPEGDKGIAIVRSVCTSDLYKRANEELRNKADEFFQKRDFAKARYHLRQSVRILEQLERDKKIGRTLHNLGVVNYQLHDYANAKALYARSTKVLERVEGLSKEELEHCRRDVEMAYSEELDDHVSHSLFFEALDAADRLTETSRDKKKMGDLLNICGIACYKAGEYEKAEKFFSRAHAVRRDHHGAIHLDVANSLNNLASALRDQNKLELADRCYLDAIEILETLGNEQHEHLAEVLRFRVKLLRKMGKDKEADELDDRASELNQDD